MQTRDSSMSLLESTVADPKHAFPMLTPAQISRMAVRGRRRPTTLGDVLYDAGDRSIPLQVSRRRCTAHPRAPYQKHHWFVAEHVVDMPLVQAV